MNTALPPDQRAQLLVQAMTLDEKVLEIHMLDTSAHPREVAGVPRLGIPVFKISNGPAGAGPGEGAYLPNAGLITNINGAFGLLYAASQRDQLGVRRYGRALGS